MAWSVGTSKKYACYLAVSFPVKKNKTLYRYGIPTGWRLGDVFENQFCTVERSRASVHWRFSFGTGSAPQNYKTNKNCNNDLFLQLPYDC